MRGRAESTRYYVEVHCSHIPPKREACARIIKAHNTRLLQHVDGINSKINLSEGNKRPHVIPEITISLVPAVYSREREGERERSVNLVWTKKEKEKTKTRRQQQQQQIALSPVLHITAYGTRWFNMKDRALIPPVGAGISAQYGQVQGRIENKSRCLRSRRRSSVNWEKRGPVAYSLRGHPTAWRRQPNSRVELFMTSSEECTTAQVHWSEPRHLSLW